MSETALAEAIEMPADTVVRCLKGENHWSLALLDRIAGLFGVPLSELDPACAPTLPADLRSMDLEGDGSRLALLFTFISDLPTLSSEEDLEALEQMLRSLSSKAGKS